MKFFIRARRPMALLLAVLIIFTSCASSYKTISPQDLNYLGSNEADGLSYSYRYNVLAERGNKKYAKREFKKGVKVIAIRIENNSGKTIQLRKDADFYMGDRVIFPMDPKIVQHQIRQIGPLYLLWSFLWLIITKCDNDDCSVTPIPIGLGIGLINLAIASSANDKLLQELYDNNILEEEIGPGEIAYGLIGLSTEMTAPVTIKLKSTQ